MGKHDLLADLRSRDDEGSARLLELLEPLNRHDFRAWQRSITKQQLRALGPRYAAMRSTFKGVTPHASARRIVAR